MWDTGGKKGRIFVQEREKTLVLVSVLNLMRTEFVDFTYSVLGS